MNLDKQTDIWDEIWDGIWDGIWADVWIWLNDPDEFYNLQLSGVKDL